MAKKKYMGMLFIWPKTDSYYITSAIYQHMYLHHYFSIKNLKQHKEC